MQNTEETRQLTDRYGDGQAGPVVAVLKCAAGLLVLVGVAAGPWLFLTPDGGSRAAQPPAPQTAKTFPNSMAESKRIFEERRQRYEARSASRTLAQDGLVTGAKAAERPPGN